MREKKTELRGSIEGLPLVILAAIDRRRYARSMAEGRTVTRTEVAREILRGALAREIHSNESETARGETEASE